MKQHIYMKISYLGLVLTLFFAFSCNTNSTKINEQVVESIAPRLKTSIDEYTSAKPDDAVVKHLDLDLKIDFENRIISGKALYTIENKKGVDEIMFDSKDLIIHKVLIGENKEKTEYKVLHSKSFTGSTIAIKIKPETDLVDIYYSTNKDAEAVQWLEPQQTSGKKHPFVYTQSQAILARTWVPCQDGPGIRITYTATVRVPKGLMAVMSAENPKEKNETGIYYFKMDQPIPSYLLALAAGDLQFASIGERTGVFAEPSVIDKAVYEFGEMENMLKTAERMYGPYNWDRYDVLVLPPSFPFGGMENPRLTFATPTVLVGDRSLTSLIAHELAHSWSGNLVTNSTWNDFWLNEGFSVYFERRIMEELYGDSYAEMLAQLGYQDLVAEVKAMGEDNKDTRLKGALEGRDPDAIMTNIPYEKGCSFLKLMEESVGRAKWDQFLKAYFEKFAFQTMSTENFVAYLKKELTSQFPNLDEKINIDRWVYGRGLPKDCPKPNSERFEQVEVALSHWLTGRAPEKLETGEWTTHEWLHFLRNLPGEMDLEQMKGLDKAFEFTNSGNSEILCMWFLHSINNDYQDAYGSIERFLVKVGRRKFLSPIYTALAQTAQGKEFAIKIYKEARPNYHSVSTGTIDQILGIEG